MRAIGMGTFLKYLRAAGGVTSERNQVTGRKTLSAGGETISITTVRPQTAVLFGDSGLADGWDCYPVGATCSVIQDGTGNAFAAISGTGINFVPGNKMAIGSAAAPYSGMFTITNCVNAPTSSVSVYAATQGVNGRIHIETIQNHGMAVGGVCTISNIVGTTEANGSWFYEIVGPKDIELVNSKFVNTYASGGSCLQRAGVYFAVPPSADLICKNLGSLGYWVIPALDKPTRRSTWANIQARLGYAFEVLNFAAVNGQPTAEMMDRIEADVISFNPGWVIMHAGANDVRIRALAPTVAAQNTYTLIKACTDAGIKVAYILWQPDNATDASYAGGGMNAKCLQFHAALQTLCAGLDVLFINQWDALSNPASSTGDAIANMLRSDGIHTSNLGGQAVGQSGFLALGKYVTPRAQLPISNVDSKGFSSTSLQLFRNPILFTATGGLVTGPLTGVAAANITVARLAGSPTGAASVVARTVVDDGDTIGNNQVAVLTGSAANDQVSISFNVTAADVAPGDVIEACCHVRSSGALAGLVNTITGFVDINTYVYKSASHGASLIGTDQPLNDINELIRMRITIPTGITVTSFRFAIVVQFSGAGSPVTINVGRVAVRKINRPALNM